MRYDRATIEPHGEEFRVYLWGTHARSSVLAGQPLRRYLTDCATESECRAEIEREQPGLAVEVLEHASGKPYVSLSHLPGEDDPVPGGRYPDDIGEWPPEP